MTRGEIYDRIKAELCTRSLWEFTKGVWHVHHPHIPLVESRPMRIICEHLEAVTDQEIRNLLLNIQPGFAKSLLVSVYWPAWEMIRWPHYQYLCVGALKDVVLRDAIRMHQVIDSPWYQQSFLPQWGWSKEQDAKGFYTNTLGGGRMSRSVGMQITGLRGNRRIVDDPIDAGDAKRDSARMEQTNDWLGAAFANRKSSKEDPLVMIMQRMHEIDPAWWMLEHEADVVHVMVPNEWDGEKRHSVLGGYEWRTEIGELACEELCDAEETARLRKILEDDYDGQYQQIPVPKHGQIFQLEYFRRWDPKNLPEFDTILGSWDLNNLREKKATKDTDPVGGGTWARAGEDYYLLWRYNMRIGLADSVSAIKKNIDDWTPDGPMYKELGLSCRGIMRELIEGKANGPSAVAMLRADPQIARLIESRPVQGEDKPQRARAHEGKAKGGHIYLPPKSSRYGWVDAEWLPLVCGFPRKRHDEDVDVMTQALLWFDENPAGGFRVF
jgi:hypothetical protein